MDLQRLAQRLAAGDPGSVREWRQLDPVTLDKVTAQIILSADATSDYAGREKLRRRALELLRELPDPSAIQRYRQASLERQVGNGAHAHAMFMTMREDPAFAAGAWFHLGEIALCVGQFDVAANAYQVCLRWRPDHRTAAARLIRLRKVAEMAAHVDAHDEPRDAHWEPFTAAFIEEIRRARVFVDGGGAYGFYIRLALKYGPPDIRIVGFESERHRYGILVGQFSTVPNVELRHGLVTWDDALGSTEVDVMRMEIDGGPVGCEAMKTLLAQRRASVYVHLTSDAGASDIAGALPSEAVARAGYESHDGYGARWTDSRWCVLRPRGKAAPEWPLQRVGCSQNSQAPTHRHQLPRGDATATAGSR
jgi:hypothetical protein